MVKHTQKIRRQREHCITLRKEKHSLKGLMTRTNMISRNKSETLFSQKFWLWQKLHPTSTKLKWEKHFKHVPWYYPSQNITKGILSLGKYTKVRGEKKYSLILSWHCRYHVETSLLICRANQWTGFCMITASVMKELKIALKSFKNKFFVIEHFCWLAMFVFVYLKAPEPRA